MQKRTIFSLLFTLLTLCVFAQEFSAGFRAGLNFSTIDGPSEMDANGNELETYELSTGFHVGGMANLKFTDIFSVRGELLYSQKGVDYNFNGDSFWIFDVQNSEQKVYATGDRSTILSVTNSYIELPFMAVGRFGRIEVSGGMSVGFLVSSRGSGELNFNGTTSTGSAVDPFTIALDYNYFKKRSDVNDVEIRQIGNRSVEIPKTLGAYYELLDEDDRLFNPVDLGLIGGVAFFVNQGLFLGIRAQYGLNDLTQNSRDISRSSLDEDNNYILLDDTDRNLTIQASVGFSF